MPSSSPLPAVVIDSFNNYADGSIIGQGGWEEYANGNNFIIESISVYEGAKALYSNSTADNVIFKSGNAMADGRQAFYIKSENRASWGDYNPGNINIRVSKSAWGTGSIFTAVGFKKNGNVVYADQDGNYHDFATFNDNEWTLLEIEWRSSDNTARYRVNSGTWTSWVSFYGSNSFTNFDNVGVGFYLAGGTGGMYIDNLY